MCQTVSGKSAQQAWISAEKKDGILLPVSTTQSESCKLEAVMQLPNFLTSIMLSGVGCTGIAEWDVQMYY